MPSKRRQPAGICQGTVGFPQKHPQPATCACEEAWAWDCMIKIYGGCQRNGVCPTHFSTDSRNVARKVLQAVEALKMVEKDTNGGQRLTPQGQRDLDRIAGQVTSANKKQ